MQFLQRLSIRNIWLTGIICHLLAAWFSKGYFHADEHFQLLEYASFKLQHNELDNLPWEYKAGMRPSMQVMVAYLVSYGFQFLNPFYIAFLLRLLSVTLALLAIYHAGKTVFQNQAHLKLYYLLAVFLWFLPYQYARFSSENWSGFLILFSMIFLLKNKPLIYCGLFCGLAFCFRYQAAFFIAGIFMWLLFIKKSNLKQVSGFVSGFLLVFILGIITDHWLYGRWVLSSYEYFYINLIEGKAAEFGTEPFYYYFNRVIETAIAPIGILMIIAFILYVYRQPKSVFTWVSLPFFVLHCIIAHKELRFLFPLVYFVPFFLLELWLVIEQHGLKQKRLTRIILTVLIILNCAILPFSSFKASNPRISLLQHLYGKQINTENLVCLNENPYHDQLWFSYYSPQYFDPRKLKVINETDSVKSGQMVIMPQYTANKEQYEVLYTQAPSWLHHVNIGKWMDRSNLWCIAIKR